MKAKEFTEQFKALSKEDQMAVLRQIMPGFCESMMGDPKRILEVVHELGGDAKHVMVFAHNPGITDCANKLSAGEHIDTMPTCAVFTACFAVDDWSQLDWESGLEAEFDYPRNHP